MVELEFLYRDFSTAGSDGNVSPGSLAHHLALEDSQRHFQFEKKRQAFAAQLKRGSFAVEGNFGHRTAIGHCASYERDARGHKGLPVLELKARIARDGNDDRQGAN